MIDSNNFGFVQDLEIFIIDLFFKGRISFRPQTSNSYKNTRGSIWIREYHRDSIVNKKYLDGLYFSL